MDRSSRIEGFSVTHICFTRNRLLLWFYNCKCSSRLL